MAKTRTTKPTKRSTPSAKRAPTKSTAAHGARASAAGPHTYTLEQLATQLGAPDAAVRAALLAASTEADRLVLGTQADSDRIVAQVPAFVGGTLAIWRTLSSAQQSSVIGYSPDDLALLVAETLTLRALREQQHADAGGSSSSSIVTRNAARAAMHDGVVLRDQSVRALLSVLPSSDPRRADIEARGRDASTYKSLADALTALAADIRAALGSAAAPAKRALTARGVTTALADRLAAQATKVTTTGRAADARSPEGRVSQRQLDLEDGIVLTLIKGVWQAFRDAHSLDESILLPPLGTLSRLFDHRGQKPAVVPAPTPPAALKQ